MGKLRVGPLELDPLSRQVWLRGVPLDLSKKEFALLRALSGEPTRVFTREELLRGVWGWLSGDGIGRRKSNCRISIKPAAPAFRSSLARARCFAGPIPRSALAAR